MSIVAAFFTLLAGLGVFLLGMKLISTNMQKLAADKIKLMLGKISNKRFAGVGIGIGASFFLQSSTATTVLLMGFVNAELISLYQSALIIMGANVGTTFTVVLFSFGYLPVGEILSFSALVGVLMVMSAKNEKTALIGWVISGFGLILIGLDMMSSSVGMLKNSEAFANIMLSLDNPLLLVLVGMLISAITQSSTATTGIAITLSEAGLMPITSAFAIIMGSNVGTCVTAILAGLGANLNSRRAAVIHLLYNTAGVILFFPAIAFAGGAINKGLSEVFSPSVSIAYFHVVFNLLTTVLLIPFAKLLTDLSQKIVKDKNPKKTKIIIKTG